MFFKTTYIVLVNLQEVASGKKFLELLLEAVNFTAYCLIRRTLIIQISRNAMTKKGLLNATKHQKLIDKI